MISNFHRHRSFLGPIPALLPLLAVVGGLLVAQETAPPAQAPPAQAPPAAQPPAQAPPAEQPPAEQPPAEQPPAQAPPAQAPPAQQPPAEAPPAQEPPGQTPPAQAPPSKEPPAQSPPEATPPGTTPPAQGPPNQTPPEKGPPAQAPPAGSPPAQTPPTPGAPGSQPATKDSTPAQPPAPGAAAAPAEADAGKIRISKVNFSGNTAVKTEDLVRFLAPLLGRPFTMEGLQDLTERVTREYERRGFATARAYLPPQEIKDETLTIAILEGAIDEIIVEGNKHYSTEFLVGRLRRSVRKGVLSYPDLERAILLLNEFSDLRVSTLMEPGKTPGTTTLRVPVTDRLPLHVTFSYDNYGGHPLNEHKFGVDVDITNFLIPGSNFGFGGSTGEDPTTALNGDLSYTLPVGTAGATLTLQYNQGNFNINQEQAALNIVGDSRGGGVTFTYPLVKDRFTSITGYVGFNVADSQLFLENERVSFDRLRSLIQGASWSAIDGSGRTIASAEVGYGLGEVFGGMPDNDPNASREGGDNSFTRVHLNLIRIQQFSEDIYAIFKASGQGSTTPLVSGEQFQIGGNDSVRGYEAGEFSGDHGYNIGVEVRWSPLEDGALLQVVSFLEYAQVFRQLASEEEEAREDLLGAGVGLRCDPSEDLSFHFDVGFPLGQGPSSLNDFTIYAGTSIRF
ncbi:MAG: ShlB/FhaC/HecB family hemolysin secretion/activation protein [Planctomycetes bacterium]|nr:ShlB/FhaC/HecB family hemolysin secretion/activation protein [Planctomycetota bacterium]